MNTTTTKQDETLVYAAKSFAENLHNDNAGNYKLHDKDCFIAGANWQKEQDKVITDKLIDGLMDSQYYLETAINATPTGSVRNILTEANIRVMSLLNSLK